MARPSAERGSIFKIGSWRSCSALSQSREPPQSSSADRLVDRRALFIRHVAWRSPCAGGTRRRRRRAAARSERPRVKLDHPGLVSWTRVSWRDVVATAPVRHDASKIMFGMGAGKPGSGCESVHARLGVADERW